MISLYVLDSCPITKGGLIAITAAIPTDVQYVRTREKTSTGQKFYVLDFIRTVT